MKKRLFLISLLLIATTGFAQIDKGESAFTLKTGFTTNSTRFTVGAGWRYALWDNFRFAGDASYLFPQKNTQGLNIDAGFHYMIPIEVENREMYAYPILGVSMQNNRFMGKKKDGRTEIAAFGTTKWGMNIGGGYEYHITSTAFLNTEMKYIFSDADSFSWTVGLGFRF